MPYLPPSAIYGSLPDYGGGEFLAHCAHQPATSMKKITRLLLLSLCSNFLGTAVSAAEHHEVTRVSFTVTKPAVSRMAMVVKTVSEVNLSDRLVLNPRLIKGGASVGVNLSF